MVNSRPRQISSDDLPYRQIRDDLFAGRYEPGAKLRIEELTATYDFGASQIRETLSRLAATGLIVYEAQRGYRVAQVSAEEYDDLVAMRLRLEPEALRQSIEHGTLEWESNVVATFHRLSTMHGKLYEGSMNAYQNWAREDRAFHAALISACRSPWLLRFSGMLIEQVARYHRDSILRGSLPMKETEEEHKRLMEAALQRNADLAGDLLHQHIVSVSKRIRDAIEAHGKASGASAIG